jgi:hypothetical protein
VDGAGDGIYAGIAEEVKEIIQELLCKVQGDKP